jgi:hypothetical protein
VVSFARDINNAGQIIGTGEWNGDTRAFLMSPSDLSGMGRFSGVVTDLALGTPLGGVRLEIFDVMGTLLAEATTDSSGSYTSLFLPEGSYFVRTSNDLGYLDEVYDDTFCTGCNPVTGAAVEVAAGTILPGVDFDLLHQDGPSVTLYEDGEDGTTDGWSVYDDDPAGAEVLNVYDGARDGQVIQLSGSGTGNGYRLNREDGSPWRNGSQFVIEWSMAFSEGFTVYIQLETTAGRRYIYYTPVDSDSLGSQTYVHQGLGSQVVDGQWRTFLRDLRADLEEAQPGVEIFEVSGFLIRGSGRVDDIRLLSSMPPAVYEDGEDGTTEGWSVYDDSPAGAEVLNVYDPVRQGQVIELVGTDTQNGFRLGDRNGDLWRNANLFVIEWSMAVAADFTIYIDLATTAGQRFLYYTPLNYDKLGSGTYVHHGLGSQASGGQWLTFFRDLRSDLDEAQPGVKILEVNGFLIRGSGRIDEIKLHDKISLSLYEDAEDGATAGWTVYDSDPAGAEILNVYDDARQSQVIELTGSGTDNGYRLMNQDGSPWGNSDHFILVWSMAISETFTIYIDTETTAGRRYLYYTPLDYDKLGAQGYVHHGLGPEAMDGQWHTFARDLRLDLEDAQPGAEILEVNGFLLRGSGRVDDILLRETMPLQMSVYETGDGGAAGWVVYDSDPPGATVLDVYDDMRQSQVIELSGTGTQNGYRLLNQDGSPWGNRNQFIIEWSMAFSGDFTIYVDVETTAGRRFLYYTPQDIDKLGSQDYVHHGLGSQVMDGLWRTIVRDLRADLLDAQPGVLIIEVNGILVRGSGRLDDIRLRS